LVYRPAPNANGNGYATIGFKVQDNGGTSNSGVDTSVNSYVLTMNVTAVNDAPLRTVGTTTPIVVNEDSANTTAVSLGLSGLTYGLGRRCR